jgi:hypothetical protein
MLRKFVAAAYATVFVQPREHASFGDVLPAVPRMCGFGRSQAPPLPLAAKIAAA